MTEEMIRLRIGKQLESKSKLEYDLAAREQDCANLRTLIEGCDANIRGLEQARSVLAEMECEMAKAYAPAPVPRAEPKVEYVVTQQEQRPPAPKPQKAKPAKAQPPRPAKRRGRPPKAKPEPIQDEPTQAGGSWNGNGGMTPEEAAAQ